MSVAPRGSASSSGAPAQLEIWTMYAFFSAFGYLLYAVGNVTPYIRDDLKLSDFSAGLHATALAAGTLTAGLVVDAVARRFGSHRTFLLAVGGCAAAALLIIGAPVLAVSLAGAYLLGFSGGTLGTQVNITLGRPGGAEARKLLARANAWAMGAAMIGPVLIAAAATVLHAWRLALVLPIVVLILVAALGSTGPTRAPGSAKVSAPPLSGRFWVAWVFIVLAVAIEFSFVFWASTLIVARTGSAKETATLAAGLFIAGMLLGRLAVGTPRAAALSPRLLLLVGLAIVTVGALVTWLSTAVWLSGAGTLLGGVGTAGLYPVGVAVALRTARGSELSASARLTLASGTAILAAPTLLGVLADSLGVTGAWPIVLALAAAAIVIALAATRGPAAEPVPPAVYELEVGSVD